jgi:hypothetical protein
MMITSGLYISYSWGDDSSPEAREREEIVVDLCHSFAKRGIVIHRDKDEVKSGDSIEEFGERIAKAPVVLAVISYRSLRSEWCMLYELYEAWVRRSSKAKEFSTDVIALVLEDALPDLKRSKALTEHWNHWCSELEEDLKAADPGEEGSLETRKLLLKCKSMIKCLPDMLLAIKRIAMPRGSAAIRRDDFSAIIAYVQGKLGGAAQDIPEPPELDLAAMQTTLQKLAHQHAGLSSPQLHACWHAAIQATWPRRTAISLFPKLASTAPLQWTDLQNSLADPGQWRHLQTEKIELLFERFAAMLEAPPSVALAEMPSPIPPSLAVLIKPTADKTPAGQAAYRCSAVLCIPLAEGGWHYEQVDATADHVFCFNPPAHRPDWQQPGAVLGRLWMAAKARLTDQGRIDREPLLDLFLPRALFDEDWSSLELEDDCGDLGVMATIFYRLRSIDRWTRPELVLYKEHFERKYTVLTGGAGHWKLLAENHPSVDLHIPSVELHKQLSLSRTPSPGQPETVAILHLGSLGVDLRAREKFYRSALESAAPVVVWLHPSLEGQPAGDRNQHVTQLFKSLNLRKPTKTKNHNQEVRRNPFELPTQKQDLPSGLVVLIEDCLEMDRDRPATPRLITVAEQAPSLGYGTS